MVDLVRIIVNVNWWWDFAYFKNDGVIVKTTIILSLVILGFLVGIPLFIAGKDYIKLLLSLQLFTMFGVVFVTTGIGTFVEGVLKQIIKNGT